MCAVKKTNKKIIMAERIISPVGENSLNSALKIWKQKSKYITEELKMRKVFKKAFGEKERTEAQGYP
jgi:ribosomal protein S21